MALGHPVPTFSPLVERLPDATGSARCTWGQFSRVIKLRPLPLQHFYLTYPECLVQIAAQCIPRHEASELSLVERQRIASEQRSWIVRYLMSARKASSAALNLSGNS